MGWSLRLPVVASVRVTMASPYGFRSRYCGVLGFFATFSNIAGPFTPLRGVHRAELRSRPHCFTPAGTRIPRVRRGFWQVELIGIEPTTSSMPWKRSPKLSYSPIDQMTLQPGNARLGVASIAPTGRHSTGDGQAACAVSRGPCGEIVAPMSCILSFGRSFDPTSDPRSRGPYTGRVCRRLVRTWDAAPLLTNWPRIRPPPFTACRPGDGSIG